LGHVIAENLLAKSEACSGFLCFFLVVFALIEVAVTSLIQWIPLVLVEITETP
jgi:hypothetical protein